MPFNCILCEKSDDYLFTSHFCLKCRRVKHLINIYGNDFYESMENVLVRNKTQQNNKIKLEHKKMDKQEKVYGDESHIKGYSKP